MSSPSELHRGIRTWQICGVGSKKKKKKKKESVDGDGRSQCNAANEVVVQLNGHGSGCSVVVVMQFVAFNAFIN